MIGISCRSDVTELLEKRVKSRFSYRRYLVLEPTSVDPESPDEGAISILREMLSIPSDAKDLVGVFIQHFNRSAEAALQSEAVLASLQQLCFKGQ